MLKDTIIPNEIQKPKAPEYRILENDPLKMTRPLALLNAKAYAVVWVKEQKIVSEELDSNGKIIKHDPPIITINNKELIVREDGKKYYVSSANKELGFSVELPEVPDSNCLWSGKGINSFINGNRPNPKDVFRCLIQVIDTFIDFNKSLADQRIMCEFVTCWILSTWFLDAFNVIGYLWISGERGSGKTDLLGLLSQLSYLGQFITHTGTFASLRDMADCGAGLFFDDVEGLTYQNDKDLDKRALLLAGNRRGVAVSLKVPVPNHPWGIRLVNAFCPKAFSAIRLPDPILASRSICVPLVRSSDRKRVNIDPLDYEEWPCERRALLDDLWGLSLGNLSQISYQDKWIGKNAKLSGRNLQPWRPVLAIAKWLEENGIQGIYQRMEELSIAYQNQRIILEYPDLSLAVIQALVACAINAIKANNAIERKGYFEVRTPDLVKEIKNIVLEQDLDIDPEKIQSRHVGRVLGRFRFEKMSRPGGIGSRMWKINIQHLVQLSLSYNILVPKGIVCDKDISLGVCQDNGTNGTNGSDGPEALQSNSTISEPSLLIKPEMPCSSCGSMDFWQRSDGGWLCNTCHPNN